MQNRYLNPWRKLTVTPRPEYYENNAPAVLEHRGVTVYKLGDRSFDFVFAGCCITQRAGSTRAIAVIDDLFSGGQAVCDTVAAHLRANGHPDAISYREAIEADQAAPLIDDLMKRAAKLGARFSSDARHGCFNYYDRNGAHAFCVSLREIAQWIESDENSRKAEGAQ